MRSPAEKFTTAILEITGLTEADIRSVTTDFICDRWVVKTWNRRTINVTGLEVFEWKYSYRLPEFTGQILKEAS